MLELQRKLISTWKSDSFATYQTWFLWEERIKNFRSIRRGIQKVIEEIDTDSFGSLYKNSSLETVLHSITEQKQLFKGADHAFQWKPKLRIPDIYENRENQKAFSNFLKSCIDCCGEKDLIRSINILSSKKIKGLGPAAANLLYFLHPTIAPPFNTAIVNGYNSLTGSKVKLGKWDEYLAMREGILRLNSTHQDLLSNDLGAVTALLFDIGSKRYLPPPRLSEVEATSQWEKDLAAVREENKTTKKQRDRSTLDENSHTQIQGWLRDLGRELGYDIWIASNDRPRLYLEGKLGDNCLSSLPLAKNVDADSIRLIDIIWVDKNNSQIIAAFEVEHSTSIYSGILRLYDLAFSNKGQFLKGIYLVAPDDREIEVKNQLHRPAFQRISDLKVKFLPYSEFEKNREAMAKFGQGLKAIEAIAKSL